MCDYCGCRRIPEIAELCEQHEKIQELADLAINLVDHGGVALTEGIARLRNALAPHVEQEETGVFNDARRAGLGSYYIDDLEDDHRRFASILAEPEHIDATALGLLVDELHRHIALEEYELFPAAARVLDRPDRQVSNRHSSSGTNGAKL